MTASLSGSRRIVTLNGTWHFAAESLQHGFGEHLGWMRADYDEAAGIPACWDLADLTLFGYEAYVWFRRGSTMSPRPRGVAASTSQESTRTLFPVWSGSAVRCGGAGRTTARIHAPWASTGPASMGSSLPIEPPNELASTR